MRKKCNIRLRRLTLWMLACLTAVCLLPGRAEEPTQPDQPENPTEPEKPGAGGKASAGGTDPSAPAAVNPMDRPARRAAPPLATATGGCWRGGRPRPAASPADPAAAHGCCISKKRGTNK